MSNRRTLRAEAQKFIDQLQGCAFPNSQRIYLQGSRSDLRVPTREIQLTPTLTGGTKDSPEFEQNKPIAVYDTSGPYGDPLSNLDRNDRLVWLCPAMRLTTEENTYDK